MSDCNDQKACQFSIPMSVLGLPPDQFVLLATSLGFLLSINLSIDEQNSLGSFLQTVGQVISTLASQRFFYDTLLDKSGQSKDNPIKNGQTTNNSLIV